jgi:uncharacterized protein YjiS (DUF1127 family)
MSTFAGYSPSLPASGMLGVRLFAGISQRAFATIRAWRNRVRQRRELLMLNDVELLDLSLTAADVNRETSRPFWQSIGLTGRGRHQKRWYVRSGCRQLERPTST